jgi:hypothetical protein
MHGAAQRSPSGGSQLAVVRGGSGESELGGASSYANSSRGELRAALAVAVGRNPQFERAAVSAGVAPLPFALRASGDGALARFAALALARKKQEASHMQM